MAASTPEFLISASRLSDGAVVYFAADRRWVDTFDLAARHRDAAARDAELAAAKQDEAHVCNAHVVEIAVASDGQLILSARERLRRDGAESVRERLGYTTPTR
jgi:hypothetical protein